MCGNSGRRRTLEGFQIVSETDEHGAFISDGILMDPVGFSHPPPQASRAKVMGLKDTVSVGTHENQ
jgi:hypothetical protein